MITDHEYLNALAQIEYLGDRLPGRNGDTVSYHAVEPITFVETPLVTVRKTAWKMALREMEWFMSGDARCPDELLPWWKEQLDRWGQYHGGYSEQFRYSGAGEQNFDQVEYVLNGLKSNPNSRRLVLTTWNPGEMADIQEMNKNPKTPTCCHSSFVQFFVRNGDLHMTSYQRSADMLLGVPHNWIQSWSLLLWFAHHAGLQVGSLRWLLGDAHIYCEESHRNTLKALLALLPLPDVREENPFELVYRPPADLPLSNDCPEFKADHFQMIGTIPDPSVLLRPKLLC